MCLQHGEAWNRAILAIGVGAGATRAPPPPSLATPGLARPGKRRVRRRGSERRGMGECNGREPATWDARAAAARWSGHAASGQEGRGWRMPAAGGWHGSCDCGGRMSATVWNGNVAVLFFFFGETASY
jgi:hypothetical protein